MNKRVAGEKRQVGNKHVKIFNLKNNGKCKLKKMYNSPFCLTNDPIPNKQTFWRSHSINTGATAEKAPVTSLWTSLSQNLGGTHSQRLEKRKEKTNITTGLTLCPILISQSQVQCQLNRPLFLALQAHLGECLLFVSSSNKAKGLWLCYLTFSVFIAQNKLLCAVNHDFMQSTTHYNAIDISRIPLQLHRKQHLNPD